MMRLRIVIRHPIRDILYKCLILFFAALVFSNPVVLPVYASNCNGGSSGLTALTELVGKTYEGHEGGLYPAGNTPPDSFQSAALQAAKQVKPLDADGAPVGDGSIGLLSIGNSITTLEFTQFMSLAATDPLRNPHLVLVDGALQGVGASPLAGNISVLWDVIDNRVNQSGLSHKQVQIVWMYQVNNDQRTNMKDDEKLANDLKIIVQKLKTRFENLKLVYVSSSYYGGYNEDILSAEPNNFETGFAVKWLIQSQIEGEQALNYDASKGPVNAPMILWGPYLWTDGVNPRKSDGLTWQCSDLNDDGVHPSTSGRIKISKLLLNFMQTDLTARPWYLSDESQNAQVDLLVFPPEPFPDIYLAIILATVGLAIIVIFIVRRRRAIEVDENDYSNEDN